MVMNSPNLHYDQRFAFCRKTHMLKIHPKNFQRFFATGQNHLNSFDTRR